MSSFPCVVRTVSGAGEVRYSLGHRLVDRYLEFVAGRARPNTLRAVAFDLKAFFAVVVKDPPGQPPTGLLVVRGGGVGPTPGRMFYPLLIERPWKKYASTLRTGT